MDHPVTAFLTLEIRQDPDFGAHDAIGQALSRIPEVLEACTITGPGDMWCRVVARSNTDLQRVIDAVLASPASSAPRPVIALATQVPYRVLPPSAPDLRRASKAVQTRIAQSGRDVDGEIAAERRRLPRSRAV
jgi:DNA-binding Lrp family transcriptional regulator